MCMNVVLPPQVSFLEAHDTHQQKPSSTTQVTVSFSPPPAPPVPLVPPPPAPERSIKGILSEYLPSRGKSQQQGGSEGTKASNIRDTVPPKGGGSGAGAGGSVGADGKPLLPPRMWRGVVTARPPSPPRLRREGECLSVPLVPFVCAYSE